MTMLVSGPERRTGLIRWPVEYGSAVMLKKSFAVAPVQPGSDWERHLLISAVDNDHPGPCPPDLVTPPQVVQRAEAANLPSLQCQRLSQSSPSACLPFELRCLAYSPWLQQSGRQWQRCQLDSVAAVRRAKIGWRILPRDAIRGRAPRFRHAANHRSAAGCGSPSWPRQVESPPANQGPHVAGSGPFGWSERPFAHPPGTLLR